MTRPQLPVCVWTCGWVISPLITEPFFPNNFNYSRLSFWSFPFPQECVCYPCDLLTMRQRVNTSPPRCSLLITEPALFTHSSPARGCLKKKRDDVCVCGIIAAVFEADFMGFVLNMHCNKYPIPLCYNIATNHAESDFLRYYLLNFSVLPKPRDLEKEDQVWVSLYLLCDPEQITYLLWVSLLYLSKETMCVSRATSRARWSTKKLQDACQDSHYPLSERKQPSERFSQCPRSTSVRIRGRPKHTVHCSRVLELWEINSNARGRRKGPYPVPRWASDKRCL